DLELRAGDAAAARHHYEEVLSRDGGSAEAMRGAARASAALGDRARALAYWRSIPDARPPGGTAGDAGPPPPAARALEGGRQRGGGAGRRDERGRRHDGAPAAGPRAAGLRLTASPDEGVRTIRSTSARPPTTRRARASASGRGSASAPPPLRRASGPPR